MQRARSSSASRPCRDQRLDRLGVPGPAQRLLAHLGDAGQRVHERAQAVAVERHQPAHALDLHVLHAAEDRHRHLPPALHDAGRAHVLLGQVVERPGHAVAVGLRRVLRHAAHHDDDLLRRPAARAGLARQQVRDARREPRVGHDGHAGGARLGAQVERVLGAERDVHEVAPCRDGRLHGAEAVARRQRARPRVRARPSGARACRPRSSRPPARRGWRARPGAGRAGRRR